MMQIVMFDGAKSKSLPSSGLYVMHELAKIKVPDWLNDLPKLATDISDVLPVLDVFDSI